MMNNLKDRVYDLVLYLATIGPRKKPSARKLLIVRVDEIGDFMLWHTLLEATLSADTFQHYEFHFCGNQSWRTLFNQFHEGSVHQSIWLDKLRFKKDMAYRYSFLKQVYREGYEVIINPTFSRDKRNDDSIVKAAKAIQTIGMVANKESVRGYELGYDRNLYTKMFEHLAKPVFEFYRNRLFAEFVSGTTITVPDTKIDTSLLKKLSVPLPQDYFVVFPGSRSAARIWPSENFVRVSNHLFDTYGWTAVVCGTKNDADYTTAFCSAYTHPVIDLTGQTSLTDMLSLFKDARCLLSVDTGSVHLATAVNCTVFGVFNGSQYGRFAPYPTEMATGFYAVYPDDIEKELQDPAMINQKYEFVVSIPYDSVKPEKVVAVIDSHYSR